MSTASTPEALARPGAEYSGSLSAGSRLGPYEIAEFIGAGGMGEVYRVKTAYR